MSVLSSRSPNQILPRIRIRVQPRDGSAETPTEEDEMPMPENRTDEGLES
jgi:hypothetical protein